MESAVSQSEGTDSDFEMFFDSEDEKT